MRDWHDFSCLTQQINIKKSESKFPSFTKVRISVPIISGWVKIILIRCESMLALFLSLWPRLLFIKKWPKSPPKKNCQHWRSQLTSCHPTNIRRPALLHSLGSVCDLLSDSYKHISTSSSYRGSASLEEQYVTRSRSNVPNWQYKSINKYVVNKAIYKRCESLQTWEVSEQTVIN